MILTGIVRLGRDAEVKVSASGTSVANFSGAFQYGKKDENGERPTQWVSFELWGERAEKLAPLLLKGQQIWVTAGSPRVREFAKKDGTVGAALQATVNDLQLIGGKPDAAAAHREPVAKPAPPQRRMSIDDIESDIPF
jgi:single-strand DNA-binding protein